MPYIKSDERSRIHQIEYGDLQLPMGKINYEQIYNAGELQYAIAIMIKSYVERTGLCYQTCNDIMGALDGAQKEFYRKVVAPYEDKKIDENGGIYDKLF